MDNEKEFREFVKENSLIVIPYEYPVEIKYNKETGETIELFPVNKSKPNIHGKQYECSCCENMYMEFNGFIDHMEEEFIFFTEEDENLEKNKNRLKLNG